MTPVEYLLVWVNVLLFFMFLTTVWKDNIAGRIAESVAVGSACGHAILIGADTIYRTGIASVIDGNMITLIGLVFGVLMFGRLTPYKWLSRYPTQLVVTVGLGVMFGLAIMTQIFEQINSSLVGLIKFAGPFGLFSNILIFVGTFTTMAYFLYTFPPFVIKQRTKGLYGFSGRVARIFMMTAFAIGFSGDTIFYMGVLTGQLVALLKSALGL